MKKLTLIITGLVLASNLHALPMMEMLVDKLPAKARTQDSQQCASFNGRWKGICTNKGEKPSANFIAVSQAGCSMVSINSELLFMGGSTQTLHTMAFDTAVVNAGYTINADWIDGNSKIQMNLSGSSRLIGKTGVYPFTGVGTLSLSGQNLKYDFKFLDNQIECTYDKES